MLEHAEDRITVIKFAEQHAKEAAAIEKTIFSEPWSEQAFVELFVKSTSIFGLAGIYRDRVVAYGGVECVLDEANIVNIAVAPESRRKGYGSAVMIGLLKLVADRGCRRVTLEVREHNEAAKALYNTFGFRPVGIRKCFYSHPVENAIVMEKCLTLGICAKNVI